MEELFNEGEGMVPRTQKARGIFALRHDPISMILGGNTPKFALIQTHSDLENFIQKWLEHCTAEGWTTSQKPMFCRPCPVRPRHGFVDSGPVKSPTEIRELWQEAIANDPEAELLVMPPIAASLSAIYTPTSISYGPGNDGATAGNDSQMIFHGEPAEDVLTRISDGKGIADGEVPYVEVVYDDESDAKPRIVQVRSGPKLSQDPNFVPYPIVVKEVIQPNGEDLIEWEKRAAKFSEGTVVWHPGGNKASHYAIHCDNNNIPYITTFEPEVGETIAPTAEKPPLDVKQFYNGIMAGTALDIDFQDSVRLMLFGLHTSAFNSTPLSWKIAGMAAMQCLRLGSAACLGEYRHHQRRNNRLPRRQIFHNAFDDFFGHQKRMITAYRSFAHTRWRSGYGGLAWAECAYQNMFLWLEMLEFMKEPSESRARHIMDAFNRAVNVAHNGGWLFNKFAPAKLMDQAAAGEPCFLIESLPAISRCSEVDTHHQGWARMRRPRVLKIRNNEEGVRALFHEAESHSYPDDAAAPKPKPKPFGVKSIQGVMRGPILHLQFKLNGKQGYKTKDIRLSNHELVSGLDHDAVSWATDKPYINFTFVGDGPPQTKMLMDELETIHIRDQHGSVITESQFI